MGEPVGRKIGLPKNNRPAVGLAHGEWRRIVVSLDCEQFAEISARAFAANTSLTEEVRLLLTWALEMEDAP